MILVVDASLFQPGAVKDVDRLGLLRLAALRRHALLCGTMPSLRCRPCDPCPVRNWCDSLRGPIQREVRNLLDALRFSPDAMARGCQYLMISSQWQVRRDCVVTLTEALRILSEPLHVLVENGLRDAEFLRQTMPSDWREQLAKWESEGRLRFEHAGGVTEMLNIATFMTTENGAKRTWGIPESAWRLTHFLVCDHDGETDASPSSEVRKLRDFCSKSGLGTQLHILRRKRQEYYLPREAMKAIVDDTVTDPRVRTSANADIDNFFANDRCFGQLPEPSEDFWKGRFWTHRDAAWSDSWFQADGAHPEMRNLAETLASAL